MKKPTLGLFTLAQNPDVDGTSFHGIEVTVDPAKLIALFGEGHESDQCKVSREWCFTRSGTGGFTLYDWKETSLYDSSYPHPDDFWAGALVTLHIGHNEKDKAQAFYLAGLLLDKCAGRRPGL